MDEKTLEERRQAGIPENAKVIQVLHNEASKMTILELQLPGKSIGLRRRLYWKYANETTYRLFGAPEPNQSFEQAVTCARATLFFCVVEWRPFGDTVGSYPCGLMSARLTDPIEVEQVALGAMLPANAWISQLTRANDEGTLLDAIVAFNEGRVRYHLCTLDLESKTLNRLDELFGTFF